MRNITQLQTQEERLNDGYRHEAAGRLACTNTLETAKEVRSTIKNTLAPCGRGQNLLANECELRNSGEGSYKLDATGMTPHQVRTKLAKRSLSPTILSPEGEEIHDETSHEAAEPKNVKDLTSYRPNVLTTSKKAAFTLAEVLITLAVIGIVAALTLPGLIQNHNEKAWSTAKDLWEKKLTETVRRMNIDGVMTGHDTTEDFMNTFKNYMKVIKTCDNNDINKCYSPKIVQTGSDSEPIEIETSDLKTAENLGNDWGTNTMSFVVADGTTAIFAYNPNCAYADPIEDTGSQVSCLAYMVDVNGKKGPNKVTQDIALVGQIALSTCDNPIGDMCWSTVFLPEAIDTTLEANKQYDPHYADVRNRWAGAKKACSDMQMSLPNRAQLAQLASNIYVDSQGNEVTIGEKDNVSSLKIKEGYENTLQFDRGYWSSDEYGELDAYYRGFYPTVTNGSGSYYNDKGTNSISAVCLGS